MKKIIAIFLLILSIKSFSQSKDSISIKIPVGKVIVEFQDSLHYVEFLQYVRDIPLNSPYAGIYNYFISLPVLVAKK